MSEFKVCKRCRKIALYEPGTWHSVDGVPKGVRCATCQVTWEQEQRAKRLADPYIRAVYNARSRLCKEEARSTPEGRARYRAYMREYQKTYKAEEKARRNEQRAYDNALKEEARAKALALRAEAKARRNAPRMYPTARERWAQQRAEKLAKQGGSTEEKA